MERQLLQEKIDHKDHQDEGDQKGLNDFLHAFRNRTRSIQRHGEVHVLGKALFHLRHQFPDAGGGVDGVRTGQLIARNDGARLPVKTAGAGIVLGAELDTGHIVHADGAAVGSLAHHDVAEFFR